MKLGFIGLGNMATAIIGGMLQKEVAWPEDIIGSDKMEEMQQKAKERFHINTTESNVETAKSADVLFLAVKPVFLPEVLQEIGSVVRQDTVIVSIVAGKSIDFIQKGLGRTDCKIVRCMPNTPALVGEGMAGVSYDAKKFSDEEKKMVEMIFTSVGKMEIVDEKLMDVVGSASGCSPAYVYMFIEALADGCVRNGLPRDMAYKMTAQAVLGSAKMVLETGMHPGALKDMVCSPGGTTIEGLAVLEECNFRGAVIKACDANFQKNKLLK